MAKELVADYILASPRQGNVKPIFGYSGDGINEIFGAWRRADQEPRRLVQARHEEQVAFEAVSYAKFTGGRIGVCMATLDPGAIQLLNGLYAAKMNQVPVLATVEQTSRTAVRSRYQQEVDLISPFKRSASEHAIRIALSERTLTCIIVP